MGIIKTPLIKWNMLERDEICKTALDLPSVNFETNIKNKICFAIDKSSFEFNYSGIRIIKTLNTNKFLRKLFDDNGDCNIKINGIKTRAKDVLIISPLTRINDLLNTKVSGNINDFLKTGDIGKDKMMMENEIMKIFNSKENCFKELVDVDLEKTDLINYVDVKEDFVDEKNILDVLEVLNKVNKKCLIIFNDVQYLSLEHCGKYLKRFDFLYIMNSFEKEWLEIKNFEEVCLEHIFGLDGEILKSISG